MRRVEPRYFRGLPITAAACFTAATVLFFNQLNELVGMKHLIFLILLFVLAFLMVSNIRYYSFKDLEILKRKPFGTLVAVMLAIVVVMAEPGIVIFIFSTCYVLLGPANTLLGWHKKRGIALEAKKNEQILR